MGRYLNSPPREFMRSIAGHPSQLGCFEIRHAGITPPDTLLLKYGLNWTNGRAVSIRSHIGSTTLLLRGSQAFSFTSARSFYRTR